MKILFVYDSFTNAGKITLSSLTADDAIYLFPLTSKLSITTTIKEKMNNFTRNIDTIQTAMEINSSAKALRNKYIQFIAEIPERIRYKGKNLRELFAIDEYTTLWWLSLVSEKNAYKSDAFNRLAQLDSIIRTIKQKKIDKIMFSCRSEKLKNALHDYSHKKHIKFETIPTKPIGSLKIYIRESQKLLYFKHNGILIYSILRALWKTWIIKIIIGSLSRKIPQDNKSLLFFTYYPNIDESYAQKAIFKNKFYTHLQEAVEHSKQNIIWVAIYAPCNNISFRKSLEYARRFIKNGYIIFFIEEFNSIAIQINTFFTTLKSGLKFLMMERKIHEAHDFFGDYNAYPLFKDDWYSSFISKSKTAYCGVAYYYMFKAVLKKLKAEKCLYPCEMHEWEKALLSAQAALKVKMPLLGYQWATISRMLLNYFNHPSEITGGKPYTMPQPEKIICNGQLPYSYMKESGWSDEKILIAEALRYNHLKKCLNLNNVNRRLNTVLLIFSISLEESISLFNISYEAFKDITDIEVWLRPHPLAPYRHERIFETSGLPTNNTSFKFKNGNLDDILSKSRVVVVGESSASIEAIAYGCDVVIVEVPEWINMSPLKDINSDIVKTANSPQSLRQLISNIFQEEYNSEKHIMEARKIISNFFYLNEKTDTPENFLKFLAS